MRRHHLVRAASTQSLCLFCACRIGAAEFPLHRFAPFPPVATPDRRHINTTRQQENSGVASVSDEKDDGFRTEQSSWTQFHSESSLSPAEQAEKANRLLQQKQHQDEERQNLKERQAIRKEQQGNKHSQTMGTLRRTQRHFGERRLNIGQLQNGEGQSSNLYPNGSTSNVGTRAFQGSDAPGSTAGTSATTRRDQHRYMQPHGANRLISKGTRQSRDIHRQGQGTIRFMPVSAPTDHDSMGLGRQSFDLSSNDFRRQKDTFSIPSRFEEVAAPDFKSPSKAYAVGSEAFKTGWGSGSIGPGQLEHSATNESIQARKPQTDRSTDTDDSAMQDAIRAETSVPAKTEEMAYTSANGLFRRNKLPRSTGSSEEVKPHNWGRTRPFSDGFPLSESQKIRESGDGQNDVQDQGLGLETYDKHEMLPLRQEAHPKDADAFNEDYAANWKHLRRQDIGHIQSEANNDMRRPPQSADQYPDDSWVDRSFEEHRRKRAASSRPEPADLPTARQPNDRFSILRTQNSQKRCARCGEMGHIARHCSGRPRITCHSCGQPGHLANECPNAATITAGSSRKSRAYMTDPYAEEPSTPLWKRSPNGETFPVAEARVVTPGSADSSWTPGRDERNRDYIPKDHIVRKQAASSRRGQWTEASEAASGDEQIPGGRQSRRDQWAGDEDENVESRKGGDRRGQRRNHRQDDDDEGLYARDQARARKQERLAKKEAERKAAKSQREARKAEQASPITLPEFISVQNLSQMLGVRYEMFVDRLKELGYDDVFPGKILNTEISGMIAMEYNFEPVFDAETLEEEERDLKARPEADDRDFLPVRPPVVTIMGHVDHGKTTLLDYLRKSSVAAGEAGGITQHIGAFSVPLSSSGKTITFLDTPGHAAFLAMRQRGANVTDMVILVVAADDSVKPQTLEAIKHAKAAKVPMIVAINKIDKEEADVQRCKQDLARHGVEIEDFGGDTQVVEVSGKTGKGMDDLEETVVTLSEILDHRAETDGDVEGWVLEATTKKAGRVATVLVRRGTLRPGDVIVAGKTWARVKTLRNEGGQLLDQVGPGMPIEVDGWKDQPAAGDEVLQTSSERKATSVVDFRLELAERDKTAQDMEAINETRRLEQDKREREKEAEAAALRGDEEGVASTTTIGGQQATSGQMEVPFIIKADVSGSAEAVSAYILGVSNPLITPKILQCSVGAINESDIELASVAQGYVIAFNLRSDPDMNGIAEAKGVKVLENNIIYRVLDDVKTVLEEKLPAIITQKVLGEAEIAASFEIGVGGRKKVNIAGCKVRNGVITKGSRVRVIRKGEKVYDGTIDSLKSVKKDVQEMRKGSECGIGFDGFEKFEVSDQIQTYEEISEKRRL